MSPVPGLTDEMWHPVTEWQDPAVPVKGPSRKATVREGVVHYTANPNVPDGDEGESADDIPAYLRRTQKDYAQNRGYSIGYCTVIDWRGHAWEGRGFELNAAANPGKLLQRNGEIRYGSSNANDYTHPILFLVDGDDRATDEQLRTARLVWRKVADDHGIAPAAFYVGPHKEYDPTACPSDGMEDQLYEGAFLLGNHPFDDDRYDVIAPPPIEEIKTMEFFRYAKHSNVFARWPSGVVETVTEARMKELGGDWDDVKVILETHTPSMVGNVRRAGVDPYNASEFTLLKAQ